MFALGKVRQRVDRRSVTGRAFAVLETFTPESPALTLSEIARRAALPLTTTHRLVGELCASRSARARRRREVPHRTSSMGDRLPGAARRAVARGRAAVPRGPVRGHPRERPARGSGGPRGRIHRADRRPPGGGRADPGRRPVPAPRLRESGWYCSPTRRRPCSASVLDGPAPAVHRPHDHRSRASAADAELRSAGTASRSPTGRSRSTPCRWLRRSSTRAAR